MANISRVRCVLGGIPTGPGVATFYTNGDPADFLLDLRQFWESIKGSLPSTVNVTAELSGDQINDANGQLTGAWDSGAFEQVNGTDTAPYPAPAGSCITWVTDGLPHGYRVRGRTFIVPLGGGAFGPNGTIDDTRRSQQQTAAEALITATSGTMLVWNRPRAARDADGSRPAVTARAGSSWSVISAQVKDRVAILTSRRS